MDHRSSGQSCLVGRRSDPQRRRSRQCDVPAALYLLPTADAWTFTLNRESTYDWANDKLTVPINFVVAKLIKIEQQHA